MIDRFDWILPDQLAVGPFPKSSSSLAYLRRMDITAILSLTEEMEGTIPAELRHSFVWQRVPIPDGFTGGVPTEEQFAAALEVLERWQKKHHVVYVHCLAGVGRSPAVCALYLSKIKGVSLDEALEIVRTQHQDTQPTAAQIEVMQRFLGNLP